MKNQLIPPPELAPPSVRHLPASEKIAVWAAMVEEGDEFVMTCLRDRVGPDGDVEKAFREWLDRRTVEHDRGIALMITNLRRRERAWREAFPDEPAPPPA
jgi:hypothetical protein